MRSNPTLVPHPVASTVIFCLALTLLYLSVDLARLTRAKLLASLTTTVSEDVHNPGTLQNIEPSLSAFSMEVRQWEPHILRWSEEHNLPPSLVALVMQLESCGAPGVRSSAGAMGLFQVMPFHFSTAEDPFDPQVNARRGLSYLARSFELAEHDIARTLAGYNGGHGIILRDPRTWPNETIRYVDWGTGIWGEIQRGDESATLGRWLKAGGAQLCATARDQMSSQANLLISP